MIVQNDWLDKVDGVEFILNQLVDKVLNVVVVWQLTEHSDATPSFACCLVKNNGLGDICPEIVLPINSILLVLFAHLLDHVPNVREVHVLYLLWVGYPHDMRGVWNYDPLLEVLWMEIHP